MEGVSFAANYNDDIPTPAQNAKTLTTNQDYEETVSAKNIQQLFQQLPNAE